MPRITVLVDSPEGFMIEQRRGMKRKFFYSANGAPPGLPRERGEHQGIYDYQIFTVNMVVNDPACPVFDPVCPALVRGSRRRRVSQARAAIALRCKEEIGCSGAEIAVRGRDELGLSAAAIARHVGVGTSAITKAIERGKKAVSE